MNVGRELLFFFSALGAFNGLLMSLYFLFVAKPKHKSNLFLGLFLLMLSIRIGKSVFFYFNHELAYAYLQFGLTACLFIGPFLYFYIRSLVIFDAHSRKDWMIHVSVLFLIIMGINFVYPFEHHIDLWRPYIIKGIYLVWLFYTVLAGILLAPNFKRIFSGNKLHKNIDIWLTSILIGNLGIWGAYYFCGITSYILGALLFSFMLYVLLMFIFFNKNKDFIAKKTAHSYKNKKLDPAIVKNLEEQLMKLMEEEKAFTHSNLKIADLAKKLNTSSHTLSQYLNDNLKISFTQYLNQYRIKEAQTMIIDNKGLTLEAIGYECGFNSKSTFYSAFKKITNTTPANYQKELLKGLK